MIKATIESGGMKVVVEGSSEDVSELIEDIQERERRRVRREEIMKERMVDRKDRHVSPHGLSLAGTLRALLKDGFFDDRRVIGEVSSVLRSKGVYYPPSTIHPMLKRMVDRGELTRRRNENEVWAYSKSNKSEEGVVK